jgi:SSS family solute:Na+ symporter
VWNRTKRAHLTHVVTLSWIDYALMATYFAFTLGIGYAVKRNVNTSTDYFLAGRLMPTWVAGLAFISANLGAQEVIGMGASGAKYGLATSHFYWLAIPAMVFVGVFMMPFYYGSQARSVPEYLRLRFDEKTRALNALTFAMMTIFSSGVSLYAMGKLFYLLLGWNFNTSVVVAALIVLSYVSLGGLMGAIYNEVMQFFLIAFGLAPLSWIGLRSVGGWSGLKTRLDAISVSHGYLAGAYTHMWHFMGSSQQNPIGVEWIGLAMGLGFVLAFGYWCTDFLVIQRAMAAESQESARRVPLFAAVPKILFPALVVLPGMIAMVAMNAGPTSPSPSFPKVAHIGEGAPSTGLLPVKLNPAGEVQRDASGNAVLDYDLATPMMMVRFYPPGMLGLGLTALLASFMAGMAGNVTAFNTVWTYDIYQTYFRPAATDGHYVWVGRMATVFGILLSVGAAYLAASFNNIMDLLQLVFAFVNAPLFATFALGMFWKRTTGHGAFCGLLFGIASAALHHGISLPQGAVAGIHGGFFGAHILYPTDLAQAFWTAIVAFVTCVFVTIVVSLVTRPRQRETLYGLVYSLTARPKANGKDWFRRPEVLAIVLLLITLALNIWFF